MSDSADEVVVESFADLASDRDLRGVEPDVVARELQRREGTDDALVAWAPKWLVEEKDIAPVGKSDQVLAGVVDAETEKAVLLACDGAESWLPKSVIKVYRRAEDAEIRLPQVGLREFAAEAGDR